MPIQLTYSFRATDELDASAQHRRMMGDLMELLPEGWDIVIRPPIPAVRDQDSWGAEAIIQFVAGQASPAEESAQARDIADAMGAPWEKSDDGQARVLAPGTGGFSSSFWQMNWAELRLVPAAGEDAELAATDPSTGYRTFRLFSLGGYYLLRSLAFISLDAGLLLFAGQALYWALGLGWPEIPLFTLFVFIASPESFFYQWLAEPESWLGLNRAIIGLLELTPLSLFLFVFGLLLLALQRPKFTPPSYDDY